MSGANSNGQSRVYVMTATGWRYYDGENLYVANNVPRGVHDLYIAEGWTRIVYQPLFIGELVYPLIEREAT